MVYSVPEYQGISRDDNPAVSKKHEVLFSRMHNALLLRKILFFALPCKRKGLARITILQ
jgi:hypothetical protein